MSSNPSISGNVVGKAGSSSRGFGRWRICRSGIRRLGICRLGFGRLSLSILSCQSNPCPPASMSGRTTTETSPPSSLMRVAKFRYGCILPGASGWFRKSLSRISGYVRDARSFQNLDVIFCDLATELNDWPPISAAAVVPAGGSGLCRPGQYFSGIFSLWFFSRCARRRDTLYDVAVPESQKQHRLEGGLSGANTPGRAPSKECLTLIDSQLIDSHR